MNSPAWRSLATAFAAAALCAAFAPRSSAAPAAVRVDLDSVIHPLSVELVQAGIEQAKKRDAAVVIIRLNTPGGMLQATQQIVQAIVASPVPVVTFVAPSGGKAASAGFIILLSADVAAMAPGTNTGAATPVAMGGAEIDATMKKKIESDAAANLRAVADKRGRNSELAQEAIMEARSFTEQEALESNLIEIVAKDEADLMAQLDSRTIRRFDGSEVVLATAGAAVEPLELTYRQRMLLPLTDPGLAFILTALGLIGIYIEFTNPGLIFPGVFGGLLAILGLMALSLLPINWAGAALIVFGVGCLIAEAFTATNGILATGGAIAMMLGAVMLIDTDVPQLTIGWGVAAAVTLPFAAITVFLLNLAVRSFRYKVATGAEAMIGLEGVAKTPIDASGGRVFVHGELWNAVAAERIETGTKVRIEAVDGLRLTVAPAGPRAAGQVESRKQEDSRWISAG